MITGHENRRSLYATRDEWHRVLSMNELRALLRAAGLGQREFAALLSVAPETFRTWDSGRRVVPPPVLQRARGAAAHHGLQTELLPLDQLAKELNVHPRTLQAAARTGRLEAHFTVKAVFGRLCLLKSPFLLMALILRGPQHTLLRPSCPSFSRSC